MQFAQTLTDRFANPRFTASFLQHLPEFLGRQRWFTSKGKRTSKCVIRDTFRVTEDSALVIVGVHFADGSQEIYQMPLAQLEQTEDQARYLRDREKQILLRIPGGPYVVDAVPLPRFRAAIYAMIKDGVRTRDGLVCEAGKLLRAAPETAKSVVPAIDTSNTAIVYNDRYFFKLFRKLDPGINPDLELVRYLSDKTSFQHCPPYGGALGVGEMSDPHYLNLGMLSGKVDNQGDAWEYFQALTERYFTGGYVIDEETLSRARLLGQRTAEMHLALGAGAGAMLKPEPLEASYRAEISNAAVKLLQRQVGELGAKVSELADDVRPLAEQVLRLHDQLRDRLDVLRDHPLAVDLIRIHADYHLGQVLVTRDDFYIIDFEGEPLLSIPERRRKRPALKDVAGMVRSFHYAARGQLLLNPAYADAGTIEEHTPHAETWFKTVSQAFLDSYYAHCGNASFLPASSEDRQLLLDLFVLEKAIYEVAYELNSRPTWLPIPLNGVLAVV